MKYFCDVLNCIGRYTILLNGSKTFKLGNLSFATSYYYIK